MGSELAGGGAPGGFPEFPGAGGKEGKEGPGGGAL